MSGPALCCNKTFLLMSSDGLARLAFCESYAHEGAPRLRHRVSVAMATSDLLSLRDMLNKNLGAPGETIN